MKLIEFPEQTTTVAKDQPQYHPMPAHVQVGDPQGTLTCCWQLTWRERLEVLLFGEIWQQVLTFRGNVQPQLLATEKPKLLHPAIKWNEGNKVVQDHRDGAIYEEATEFERTLRGLPAKYK